MLASLATNFTKCVKGYHLINDDPIKEARWEDINITENMKKYIVGSCIVNRKRMYNYIELYDLNATATAT